MPATAAASSSPFNIFRALTQAYERGYLGHALMFQYPVDSEIMEHVWFRQFVSILLCPLALPELRACGQCESCLSLVDFGKSAHPDFHVLHDSEGAAYSVAEVKTLLNKSYLQRASSANKVIIIDKAHKLCQGASLSANKILKSLEEPPKNTIFILCSQSCDQMIPTIKSRVQFFRLSPKIFQSPYYEAKGTSLIAEELSAWQNTRKWMQTAVRAFDGRAPACPADQDVFWKNREQAIDRLELVQRDLWKSYKENKEQYSSQQDRRMARMMDHFEEMLKALRSYANGPLQWYQFRLQNGWGI